jgi:serine/threonine protein phosphatase PrpC
VSVTRPRLRFHHAILTDVGRVRQRNEDMADAAPKKGIYVLADGMGGHPAGNVASKTAVEALIAHLVSKGGTRDRPTRLRESVLMANRAVLSLAETDPSMHGMGTTVCVLWLSQARAYLAHIGDSRIYVMRDGEMHQVTRDHTVVRELIERGELAEGSIEAQRIGHILTQAVGLELSVEPDLGMMPPKLGDIFLICSDGLSDTMSDAAMAEILKAHTDLDECAKALVNAALEAGGHDNITVLLVRCDAAPPSKRKPKAPKS